MSWFQQKVEWLESVAETPALSRLALAIAVKLAWKYFNSETHLAWPAVATLAEELAANRRSVQRALNQLVEAGKLAIDEGGLGAKNTNTYRIADDIKGGVHAALNGNKCGVGVQIRAASTSQQGRRPRRPIPEKESGRYPESVSRSEFSSEIFFPEDEPIHRVPSKPRHQRRNRSSQSNRAKALPKDWQCGVAERNIARGETDWDDKRIAREFRKFFSNALATGKPSANWQETWRSWCMRGVDFDNNRKSAPSALQRSADGLAKWYSSRERRSP